MFDHFPKQGKLKIKYFTLPLYLNFFGYATVFYSSICRLSWYIAMRTERPAPPPPPYFRQVGAYESVAFLGGTIVFQPIENDLGVLIDGPLTMREHVQRIGRASYYQLTSPASSCESESTDVCVMMVHAFVSSRLDYCNSLLASVCLNCARRLV